MNSIPSDTMDEDTTEDIEWELQHIKDFSNEKQLDLLRREVGHIVDHGLFPSEEWYDKRFEHINMYSQLTWIETANRFHNKDQYIHDTSLQTMGLLDELIEERGTRPNFNILTYHRVINNIYNIWNYYSQTYMGNEDDPDMMDLIEGMTFLCK
jgi:hypothetical protein